MFLRNTDASRRLTKPSNGLAPTASFDPVSSQLPLLAPQVECFPTTTWGMTYVSKFDILSVFGFHDADAVGAWGVTHWIKKERNALFSEAGPILPMLLHEWFFLVRHVQKECRSWAEST